MLKTFRLGRLFGFPIEVNLSFLLMLGAVLLWMGGLTGVFVVLLAFASVILHELGHSLVARRLGVGVSGIELHFFGGAAKMIEQPKNARDEILIAIAGPAVSAILAGLGWLTYAATGLGFFYLLASINTVIAIFNMVPALPMDGGRVLRAALTYRFSFRRATEISVKIARAFAIALGVLALAGGQIMLALLAIVLWMMGTVELRNAQVAGYRDDPTVMPAPSMFDQIFGGLSPTQAGAQYRVHRYGDRIVFERIE